VKKKKKKISFPKMKLWKSKKSSTTSCVSAVSGKLSGNKNGYKDDGDQNEATSTSQSTTHLANGLHQGNDRSTESRKALKIFTHDETSSESSAAVEYSNFAQPKQLLADPFSLLRTHTRGSSIFVNQREGKMKQANG
jgi:hypothetical protein